MHTLKRDHQRACYSISSPRRREMKITALATYFLSAPLPQPVRTSTSTISRVSELVVRLTTDAGLVGIGEAHGPSSLKGVRKACAPSARSSSASPSRRRSGPLRRRADLAGSLRPHLH